ncbi:MAG: hypothetical protein QE263_08115 [Vampirovibrionales bacterium]|nr:hypothetical protein [Vampirovibrionales bacterium]
MYQSNCAKCSKPFETKNPKRVICPDCLYPDGMISGGTAPDGGSFGKIPSLPPEDKPSPGVGKPPAYGDRNEPPQQGGGYGAPPQQQGYGRPPQQGGGYGRPPQQQGYGRPPQQGGGYGAPPQQQGYGRPPQQGGGYGAPPQQQGYGRPPQQGGGYGAPRGGGYGAPPQRGGFGGPPRGGRPGGFGGRPGGRPGGPPRGGGRGGPKKNMLVNPQDVAKVELLYRKALPLPNPDVHEIIGQALDMKPSVVFFAINLIRQKMKLPKLDYPKRKLAVSPEQLMAVEALYEPYLPIPPIGIHKIISKQLKMDEWRVHVGIGLIRKNKSMGRWNEGREDLPESMKESLAAAQAAAKAVEISVAAEDGAKKPAKKVAKKLVQQETSVEEAADPLDLPLAEASVEAKPKAKRVSKKAVEATAPPSEPVE